MCIFYTKVRNLDFNFTKVHCPKIIYTPLLIPDENQPNIEIGRILMIINDLSEKHNSLGAFEF